MVPGIPHCFLGGACPPSLIPGPTASSNEHGGGGGGDGVLPGDGGWPKLLMGEGGGVGNSWETETQREGLLLVNTGFRYALTLSRSGGGEDGWGWSSS